MAERPRPIVIPIENTQAVNDPLKTAMAGGELAKVFGALIEQQQRSKAELAKQEQAQALKMNILQALTPPPEAQPDTQMGTLPGGSQSFSLPQLAKSAQTPQDRAMVESIAGGADATTAGAFLKRLLPEEKEKAISPSWKTIKDKKSPSGYSYQNLNNPKEVVPNAPEPRAATEINFGKPASPGERTAIAEGRAQIDALDNMMSLYSPDFVGPVQGRIGKLSAATGLGLSKEEASFRSAAKTQAAELKRFYFGTAQTVTELKNSLESIPDVNMPEEQFRASIIETKKNIERILKRKEEVLEQSGLRVPKSGNTKINIQNISDDELLQMLGD